MQGGRILRNKATVLRNDERITPQAVGVTADRVFQRPATRPERSTEVYAHFFQNSRVNSNTTENTSSLPTNIKKLRIHLAAGGKAA